MLFLGIDGGGSKTRFALCDDHGRMIGEYVTTGSSYRELGVEKVCALLKDGTERVLTGRGEVAGVCFGMPCYGENMAEDLLAAEQIRKALSPLPVTIENDVAAAWAGALAFRSGIIVLAGTGSMAMGRDAHGEIQRAGGWSEFFSDEGSGYWLGKKTLELFGKQADGRLPQSRLVHIVREHFSLRDDYELVGIVDSQIKHSRSNVAALQMLLRQAALDGDESAIAAYREAARELAALAIGLRSRMDLAPESPISYAGGLFNVGKLILEPFAQALKGLDMPFVSPILTPVDGAILFAVNAFARDAMPRVIEGIKRSRANAGAAPLR